ncbi:MAG: hypothetical protein ACLP7F_15695 [Acidimicrobiales bacterium]
MIDCLNWGTSSMAPIIAGQGKPDRCSEPVVASGWLQVGVERWHQVDACSQHSGQLRACC